MIYDFIRENGPVSRSQILDHISCMKPEGMSDKSWYQKISNTLACLRESGDVVMEAVVGVRYTPSEGREGHVSSIVFFDTISEMTDIANNRPIRDGMRPIAPTGKSNRLTVHMPITERTKQTAHLYLMSIFDNEFNMMLQPSLPFLFLFVMAESDHWATIESMNPIELPVYPSIYSSSGIGPIIICKCGYKKSTNAILKFLQMTY